MNPGPVEEAGKAVGGIIESMKAQPMLLAMFIINIGLLLLIWRIAEAVGQQRERDTKLIYENQKVVQEILSRCVVTEPKRMDFRLQSDESKPVELPMRKPEID